MGKEWVLSRTRTAYTLEFGRRMPKKVFVAGDFNKWAKTKNQMTHEDNGYWGLNIPGATVGNEYKYILHTDMGVVYRNDPYARK